LRPIVAYGGRIETITGSTEVTIEMGATWFGKQHPTLTALLDELGIPYFTYKGYFTI
jgi:monoamine oxidase